MGLILSNCLKGVYEDLPSVIAQPFNKPKPARRQMLDSLLANKENNEVDGRKHAAAPPVMGEAWRSSANDSSPGAGSAQNGFDPDMAYPREADKYNYS